MLYTWRDVKTEDFPLIDGWLDEKAVGFTGLDEGFGTYYGYWLEEPETIPGENFWVKLFCRDGVPAGVVAMADCQASATPKKASKGERHPKHFLGLRLIDKTIFCKISLSKE